MKRTKHHRAVALALVAVTATAFAACGSDDDDSSATASEVADDSSATASEVADDGPNPLAKGQDIELVGGLESGLGNQTLNIDVEEEDGKVTGEFRITDNVIPLECADTDTDGVVILGGEATSGSDFTGMLLALIIREGDPDSVHLYPDDSGARSCTELLESIPEDLLTEDGAFVAVEDGYDIETG